MRTLLACSLLLLFTGCSDRPNQAESSGALSPIPAGPDPIVLRVSQGGGLVSALSYPSLDSVVWRSTYRLPPISRIIGYHADDGYLTAVDTSGRPARLDLRLGAVTIPGSAGATLHATADGATIYAVNVNGDIARYTPVGDRWTLAYPQPDALLPVTDGSLVIARSDSSGLILERIRPPDTTRVDSIHIAGNRDGAHVQASALSERIFISYGSRIHSVRTRDFVHDLNVEVESPVKNLVTSPSGDRIYASLEGSNEIQVIDRFEGRIVQKIELPGSPTSLRMDPLGRALLVRADSDSIWVINIGTSEVTGSLKTTWRGDLPLVLADGAIALVHGDTVTLASSIDLGVSRQLPGAAKDFWYNFRWNGFRPRASGIDEPVRFRESETTRSTSAIEPTVLDSSAPIGGGTKDSSTNTDSRTETAQNVSTAATSGAGYTVQFAAVLSEALAREAAAKISIDGRTPRISTSVRGDRTLYRVVLGPFPTKEEAERAGQMSGQSYWVFEGAP